MPSGAKKRKAAKKKLQREAHKNGSLSQGNDEPKFDDERESDGGEVEKDSNHEEGAKEEEGIIDESSKEAKAEENLNDVAKEADDVDSSEGQKSSGSSGSSSSSSSDDDEVAVEKDQPVDVEVGQVEKQSEPPVSEADVLDETDNTSYGVPEGVSDANLVSEERIPTVESIKEVVSYPEGSGLAMDDVPVENSSISDAAGSGLIESVDKVLPQSDQNETIYSVDDTKVILVDAASGNTCEHVENATTEEETLLPQSSGVTTVDRSCVSDHVKESEKLKVEEQQLLISSAPPPVRRTSWMGCCGLFEVFSGSSSR